MNPGRETWTPDDGKIVTNDSLTYFYCSILIKTTAIAARTLRAQLVESEIDNKLAITI
jgi:hypothetical protein